MWKQFKSRHSHILLTQTVYELQYAMAKYLEQKHESFYLIETQDHSLVCNAKKRPRQPRSGDSEQYER